MFDSLFGEITSEPTTLEIILEIIKGLSMNFLITFLAAIIPLGMGIPLSLLAKKSQGVSKIFGWLRIPFESICIPIFIVIIFYVPGMLFGILPGSSLRIFSVIFAMTTAYLLYIPSRYNNSYSFLKNTLINSLGLISALFKWSFVAKIMAVFDALNTSTDFMYRGIVWPLILTFIIVGAILLIVEAGKTLIKQFMK